MTNKIINGDYVKAGNTLEQIEYIDELLQSIKIVLTAGRGSFYPNKNFGSNIRNICQEPRAEYAIAYARQALDTLDGVCVKGVTFENNQATFTIDINNEERQVTVSLESNI